MQSAHAQAVHELLVLTPASHRLAHQPQQQLVSGFLRERRYGHRLQLEARASAGASTGTRRS
jgi:hypothetical protein